MGPPARRGSGGKVRFLEATGATAEKAGQMLAPMPLLSVAFVHPELLKEAPPCAGGYSGGCGAGPTESAGVLCFERNEVPGTKNPHSSRHIYPGGLSVVITEACSLPADRCWVYRIRPALQCGSTVSEWGGHQVGTRPALRNGRLSNNSEAAC